MAPDPHRHLPLKPVDLHLLLALAEEDRHGYALVQAISQATNGLIELDPGNLYRVIKRMLAAGLVAESERRGQPDPGEERRRYYRLTALGRKVVALELRRLDALLRPSTVRTIMRSAT